MDTRDDGLGAKAQLLFQFIHTEPPRLDRDGPTGELLRRSAAAAAWVMAAVCVGLGFLLPERGFLCVPVAVASAGLTVFLLRRNLGGMCGDISGAAITLGEACGCAALLL